ncbi:glutathione synthase [Myxococcota bacterium]|nr:glutathione synthase [Myxococcota bacterium]
MPNSRRSLAFVMDPVESIDIRVDTTFVLMLEAQLRGHRVWVIDPGDLGVRDGRPQARAREVTLRREVGNHVDLGPWQLLDLDRDTQVVWQRKDPPVDAAYTAATQILSLCRHSRVLNRPAGILSANEKLYALHFADLMPETLVSRDTPALLDFLDELGGEMIVKPLDGKGGEGIFHVRRDDRNLTSILEQGTAFGSRPLMAQRYLSEVRAGDKRILLVDGDPIGAVLRIPAEHETRANLHVGGRAAATRLDQADERIVERLRPWLQSDGLFFVGIDVIGGYLTEVNVTSPTGVQEANVDAPERLEVAVLDAVERLLNEQGDSATS